MEVKEVYRFVKWASDLGISDTCMNHRHTPVSCLGHSLSISYFSESGGRGLGAARDIRKGELILRVPKHALITRESLLKDEHLLHAVKMHPSMSSSQILTVCLLTEMNKGKGSPWHPYLMQLPRSYDLLECFGQYEARALQVDEAIWSTERASSKAESEWKEAIDLLVSLRIKAQLQTLEAWLWASATISSRALYIPWDDAGCLCPVGDFFNYATPGEQTFDFEDAVTETNPYPSQLQVDLEEFDPHAERLIDAEYEEDVAAYCFYARKNYKKGEQVLLCYGLYTNLELLEHYGFLLNDNPNDKTFITLKPAIYLLSSWPKGSLYIGRNGKPSFALLSTLRLWSTPPSLRKSVKHIACSGSRLSAENEICVMNFISQECRAILNSLPTSVEDDILILRNGSKVQMDLGSDGEIILSMKTDRITDKIMGRWRLAVQWRMRYKKILLDCISYCTHVTQNLRGGKF